MSDVLDPVAAVRRFNRFYTRRIGVLDQGHLGAPYTLAETRVLYEIDRTPGVTPKAIGEATGLDAGYLSRIVKRFEREGLVTREACVHDRRSIALRLTPAGAALFAGLQNRTIAQVEDLIGGLSAPERRRLTGALAEVEALLAAPSAAPTFTLRPHRVGDMGWVIHRHGVLYAREYGWDERFEALVAHIAADFIDAFDPVLERCWIAERGGEPVGSIFLVKGEAAGQAKLRLLLVEPSARGLGVGRALVAECVAFARAAGYAEITLWTQSILTAARKLYAEAGFELARSWANDDIAPGLISETWTLKLQDR